MQFIEDLEVERVIFLRFKEGKLLSLDNLGSNAWKLTSSSIILKFVANDWVGILEDLEVEGVIFLHFEEGKFLSLNNNNLDSWILTSPFSIILGFVANDRVGVFEDLKWKKYGKLIY